MHFKGGSVIKFIKTDVACDIPQHINIVQQFFVVVKSIYNLISNYEMFFEAWLSDDMKGMVVI